METHHNGKSNLPKSEWIPSPEFVATTNIAWLMRRAGVTSYEALHAWSVQNREAFWASAIERLGICFQKPFSRVLDLADGVEAPHWLPDARLNIVDSCFVASTDSPAIVHQAEGGELKSLTAGELKILANRVAVNLARCGFKPGDAIAIIMPMTAEAVAIYLGIIQAGCAVVGIPDSFRPKEIATRLQLAKAVAVFTQDLIVRGGKELPLYANVVEADAPPIFVLPTREQMSATLRACDCAWMDFFRNASTVTSVTREPGDVINILFSSGTTGEPKAIPWTQATPIKCATDAHFHQDIRPGDVLVWPTNIGWMMGPWLIFASLLNRATIGLYEGVPTGRGFGGFVQNAKTTMLGVVPSLVKMWRNTGCLEGMDWSSIRTFSSTGECSCADDMRWLTAFAGGRPVIEYCGGTEIGGGYITGTVTRPCLPGMFNAPALGLDFVIVDEQGRSSDSGELYLIPPSIGLSTRLLNKDHHEVYFAAVPLGPRGELLRRHGDEMEKLASGYWRAHGRADDTMNLGGIKVSSAEIERVLLSVPSVVETAAIAVAPNGGPSSLVIYAVCSDAKNPDYDDLKAAMQDAIKRDLNPLLKIHDLVFVSRLPRTASNKVRRRTLRNQYVPET